jgi:hypothetical protein
VNKEELRKVMIRLENTYFSEEEVINYFVDLYGLDINDIDLLNDVNELFDERGYNCLFLMPTVKHKSFDLDEYCSYASKFVTKSKDKTFALIKYLKEINSIKTWLQSPDIKQESVTFSALWREQIQRLRQGRRNKTYLFYSQIPQNAVNKIVEIIGHEIVTQRAL